MVRNPIAFYRRRAVNNIAEEIKRPARNLPLSIIVALLITTALYLLTNVAFFIVLDASTISASDAVAVEFAKSAWGSKMAALIPLIISVSLFGTSCGEAFSNARIYFAAARQGHLASFMSYVHVNSRVPIASTIVRGVIAVCYTLTGSAHFLVEANVLLDNACDIATVCALVMLRRSMPNATRCYRVPSVLVIVRFLICLTLAAVPLYEVHRYRFHVFVVFVTVISGIVYYWLFVRLELTFPGSSTTSCLIQKCLYSAPCENELEHILEEERKMGR